MSKSNKAFVARPRPCEGIARMKRSYPRRWHASFHPTSKVDLHQQAPLTITAIEDALAARIDAWVKYDWVQVFGRRS
jgi:hypothetical protein